MSSDDHAVGPPERLHPLFLLTGLGGRLRGLVGAYLAIAYLVAQGKLTGALVAAVLILLVTVAGIILYWRRFEYRVGESEIRIDSGILNRTHRSIPFERIQDVEIAQGPVARLLGLAEVKFETGAVTAKSDEAVLQAVSLDRAEAIRTLVRARRTAAAPVAAESEEAPPIYAMDLPRLLLAGLFNFSFALFAGLFGLTQTFGDVLGFDPLSREFWRSALSAGDPIAQFVLAHRLVAVAAGLLSLVVVGVVTGMIRTLLSDYGFRLEETGRGLRRRRGLLTKTDVTLPVSRAQAVIVGTGPVRDSFGWRELKLQSLARDEGGKADHVLAPLADEEEVNGIVGALGWRRLGEASNWQRMSNAYAWLATAVAIPFLLVVLEQARRTPAALVAVLVIGTFVAVRWLSWSRSRYALDDDRLLVRTGWWRRRLLVLPVRRIQSIDLTQNFAARAFGTAGLTFGVAGGSSLSVHRIPAVAEKSARALRDRLISSAA